MPVVAQEERSGALRPFGLSEALIRLSSGERLHALFELQCKGPPFYCYHGAGCPDGPPLVPLWDWCDSVTGVWVRDGRLEFIRFDIEAAAEYEVLAKTEQGLWGRVFLDLYEARDDLSAEDFREAARVVGFRFLDQLVGAYESAELSSVEAYAAFVKELVRGIDGGTGVT